jgi:pyocin large subunit-like protein
VTPTTNTLLPNNKHEGSASDAAITMTISMPPGDTSLEESVPKVAIITATIVGGSFASIAVLIGTVIMVQHHRHREKHCDQTQHEIINTDEPLQVNERYQTNTDIIQMMQNQAYGTNSDTATCNTLNPDCGNSSDESEIQHSTYHVYETLPQ